MKTSAIGPSSVSESKAMSIRLAAFLRCLDDSSKAVREEAAEGLGKRQDQRLIPKLLTMLEEPEFTLTVANAAAYLLGLEPYSPELTAEDYKAALKSKFPN
jgi:HEAT repeat protein